MDEQKLKKVFDPLCEFSKIFGMDTIDIWCALTTCPPVSDEHFPVTVLKSHIHGQGVFATKDIPKGTVCTLYPCDAISKGENLWYFRDGVKFNNIADYMFNVSPVMKISGNPCKWSPIYCGHMINDPSNNVIKIESINENTAPIEIIKTIIEYEIKCTTFENCFFASGKNYCYVVADRDIKKGEELLASYGSLYWLKHKVNLGETLMSLPDGEQKEFYKKIIWQRLKKARPVAR